MSTTSTHFLDNKKTPTPKKMILEDESYHFAVPPQFVDMSPYQPLQVLSYPIFITEEPVSLSLMRFIRLARSSEALFIKADIAPFQREGALCEYLLPDYCSHQRSIISNFLKIISFIVALVKVTCDIPAGYYYTNKNY